MICREKVVAVGEGREDMDCCVAWDRDRRMALPPTVGPALGELSRAARIVRMDRTMLSCITARHNTLSARNCVGV